MSAYSNQQFCLGDKDALKLRLCAHSTIPRMLLLTIAAGPEAAFTLSADTDQLLAIVRQIAALFEGPVLKPDEARIATHGKPAP